MLSLEVNLPVGVEVAARTERAQAQLRRGLLDGLGRGRVELVARAHLPEAARERAAGGATQQLDQVMLGPRLGGRRAVGVEGLRRGPRLFITRLSGGAVMQAGSRRTFASNVTHAIPLIAISSTGSNRAAAWKDLGRC